MAPAPSQRRGPSPWRSRSRHHRGPAGWAGRRGLEKEAGRVPRAPSRSQPCPLGSHPEARSGSDPRTGPEEARVCGHRCQQRRGPVPSGSGRGVRLRDGRVGGARGPRLRSAVGRVDAERASRRPGVAEGPAARTRSARPLCRGLERGGGRGPLSSCWGRWKARRRGRAREGGLDDRDLALDASGTWLGHTLRGTDVRRRPPGPRARLGSPLGRPACSPPEGSLP